jgi:hypothetical protein
MCAGEPRMRDWTAGHGLPARFFHSAGQRLGMRKKDMRGYPSALYCSAQAAQVFGILEARRSIYPRFPRVVSAEQS